jgi:hypothetical protein
MKKLLSSRVAIIIAIMALTWSCKKSEQQAIETQSSKLKNVEGLVNMFEAKYYSGKLEFAVTADKALAVSVAGSGSEKDIFLLSVDSLTLNTLANTSINGEVLYFRHAILINSNDDAKRYYIKIDDAPEKLISSELSKDNLTSYTKTVTAKSISRFFSTLLPSSLSDIKFNQFKDGPQALNNFVAVAKINIDKSKGINGVCGSCNPPIIEIPGGGEGPGVLGCPSGGSGASQCGIGGGGGSVTMTCEVTCTTGYYACCGLFTGCKCYKI